MNLIDNYRKKSVSCSCLRSIIRNDCEVVATFNYRFCGEDVLIDEKQISPGETLTIWYENGYFETAFPCITFVETICFPNDLTPSVTPTFSPTPNVTPSNSSTPTNTPSRTNTKTPTPTQTPTKSPSVQYTNYLAEDCCTNVTNTIVVRIPNSVTIQFGTDGFLFNNDRYYVIEPTDLVIVNYLVNSLIPNICSLSIGSLCPDPTPTATRTPTFTPTNTKTPTQTQTSTPQSTPSVTVTNTTTPTNTPSQTQTPSNTVSSTPSPTPTLTPTNTVTQTNTSSQTPTLTQTPTNTVTTTVTSSTTPSAYLTPTATQTNTLTPTATQTNTVTPSTTPTLTPTNTQSLTNTTTSTPTNTNSNTNTASITPTNTTTSTLTPTQTPSTTKCSCDTYYLEITKPNCVVAVSYRNCDNITSDYLPSDFGFTQFFPLGWSYYVCSCTTPNLIRQSCSAPAGVISLFTTGCNTFPTPTATATPTQTLTQTPTQTNTPTTIYFLYVAQNCCEVYGTSIIVSIPAGIVLSQNDGFSYNSQCWVIGDQVFDLSYDVQISSVISDICNSCGVCPTTTPTITPSPTRTTTRTPSVTPTNTKTPTNTVTQTNTSSQTPTLTQTPTNTITTTVTSSTTPSAYLTPTATQTNTLTPTTTSTVTPTITSSITNTPSITSSSTVTPTQTMTSTCPPCLTYSVYANSGSEIQYTQCAGLVTFFSMVEGEQVYVCAIEGTVSTLSAIIPATIEAQDQCGNLCNPTPLVTNTQTMSPTPTNTASQTQTPTNSTTPTVTPTNTITPTTTACLCQTYYLEIPIGIGCNWISAIQYTNCNNNLSQILPPGGADYFSQGYNTSICSCSSNFNFVGGGSSCKVVRLDYSYCELNPTPSATASPTSTPTPSITNTQTQSQTRTLTPTMTQTTTMTQTPTVTNTQSPTPTNTVTTTNTSSTTPSAYLTPTTTQTNTGTVTNTPTITPTNTVSSTNTPTVTSTITNTPSNTITNTTTQTQTTTVTCPPCYTFGVQANGNCEIQYTQCAGQVTYFSMSTGEIVYICARLGSVSTFSGVAATIAQQLQCGNLCNPTPLVTNTQTNSPTPTTTKTQTPTNTVSQTETPTPTPTITQTITQTSTLTQTPTNTLTQTQTVTQTITASQSPTTTQTGSVTPTVTSTPTNTVTTTITSSTTPSAYLTPTTTQTNTVTVTNTPTVTPTNTLTQTNTSTTTSTNTPSVTQTQSQTQSQTVTPTVTPTNTVTQTVTSTVTPSVTNTKTPTQSVTSTVTPTQTPSQTPTVTLTPSPSSTQAVCYQYTLTINDNSVTNISYVACDGTSQNINVNNPGPLPGFDGVANFTGNYFTTGQVIVICSKTQPVAYCDSCPNTNQGSPCSNSCVPIVNTGLCPLCPCVEYLVTVQPANSTSNIQGCIEWIEYTDCYSILRRKYPSDFGYSTLFFPKTKFTICSCTQPVFPFDPNCEDIACAVQISDDCIGRLCFTWEVVVPPLASIETMNYNDCDQSGTKPYSPVPLYSGTYFICSLTIPVILTYTQAPNGDIPYVNTDPSLTSTCTNPIPQIPTFVGTCSTWTLINNLNVGESVTITWTECDRRNYVMQVDSSWTPISFCSFFGPTFVSGSPNNDVFQRLLVSQADDYCGCYYGCSSGYECLTLARPTTAIPIGVTEQWLIPSCGGNNYPSLTYIQIDNNSNNYIIPGVGVGFTACTVNPFQWWTFYTDEFEFNQCANFTTTYPLSVPQELDTIPSGFGGNGYWLSVLGINGTPIFDLPSTYPNVPNELGESCGCNNIGFANESCVVLRDCCTGNIVYTGTIMNNNYSWVINNYTVSNLGLTDCCLYLDGFVPPTIITGIDPNQILKQYRYPDNNGFITSYETTGCNVCLNPTPTPTMTQTNSPTPSPTPYPIYSWYWSSSFNPPSGYFGTFGTISNTSSCFISRIFIDPITSNGINLTSFLSTLANSDNLEIQSGTKARQFYITQVSFTSGNYVFDIAPQGTCTSQRNFTFTNNTLYNIKFFKR